MPIQIEKDHSMNRREFTSGLLCCAAAVSSYGASATATTQAQKLTIVSRTIEVNGKGGQGVWTDRSRR